jgi:hypothetical protein
MTCSICNVSEEEKRKFIKEFSDEIFPIVTKYLKKVPEPAIAAYLIHLSKELMCSWGVDYYLMLGVLTDMLNDDLVDMFEKAQNPESMEKDGE